MQKNLNVTFLAAVKPGDKRTIYADTKTPNLRFIVHPTGKKVWAWQGKVGPSPKTITLGKYPAMGLADARAAGDEINEANMRGEPIGPPKEAELVEEAPVVVETRTCDWLFDLYMGSEGKNRVDAHERRLMYDRDIKPQIGSMCVDKIDHDDLAKILRAKAKAFPAGSNNLQKLIRRWFRWSVTSGRDLSGLKTDPAAYLVKLAPTGSRNRFLSDYEIGVFFRALDQCPTFLNGPLETILYMGHRRNEAVEAQWLEFDFGKGVWSIEGDRTKTNQPLVLGMPVEMTALFKKQKAISGNGTYVWPAVRPQNGEEPKPINTFTKCVNKLNDKTKEIAEAEGKTMAPWTIHDLRRTLSSGMNALMGPDDQPLINSDIVERVLNHTLGGVRGIYNRHAYFAEKKAALRLWADHLEGIRAGVLGARPSMPESPEDSNQPLALTA